MRIIIHADASSEVGSGHVMRSSVLAEEAINRGLTCIFVGKIRDLPWLDTRIRKLGFREIHDSFETFRSNSNTDILVLDSYILPINLPEIQPRNWKLIVCISDILTPPYQSNIKVCPSLIEIESKTDKPKVLSGPSYLLIRKSISKKIHSKGEENKLNVVVNGGGTDFSDFANTVAVELEKIDIDMRVHLFTNKSIHLISNHEYIIHRMGSNFDEIASKADIAITTASTSSLEYIAREIPIGVLCVADNQNEYYRQLGELGLAQQLGKLDDDGSWNIDSAKLKSLLTDAEVKSGILRKIRGLVDLKGATRVLSLIEKEFKKY